MKKNNIRITVITTALCLLPVILGIILYEQLPNSMPIHFNFSNEPDNFAPKNFALFGIPVIMAAVQLLGCLTTSRRTQHKELPPAMRIMIWYLPIMTISIYTLMIRAALGNTTYLGRIVCLILGLALLTIGNYVPKMNYETGKYFFHPTAPNEKIFRKRTRYFGYTFVFIGAALLILMLFI